MSVFQIGLICGAGLFLAAVLYRLPKRMDRAHKIRQGILLLMWERESFTFADVCSMVNLPFDEIVAGGGGLYLGQLVDDDLLARQIQSSPATTTYSATKSGKRFAEDVLSKTLPK